MGKEVMKMGEWKKIPLYKKKEEEKIIYRKCKQ